MPPLHVTWDISVGNLVTWILTLVSVIFAAGRLAQILTIMGRDLTGLMADFHEHREDDAAHFERLHNQLLHLAFKDKKGL